jgi:hypothetical protein
MKGRDKDEGRMRWQEVLQKEGRKESSRKGIMEGRKEGSKEAECWPLATSY